MIITLPKIGPVRFDDNLSSEELNKQVGLLAQKYDFKIPKRDVGISTLLKEGFMRGMGETGIALGDILPAMGASKLGFDDYAQRQMEEADVSRQALEAKYPTQFKSYTEVESPFEAFQFGAETIGELGPTALTAIIPGAGFGAVGTRLGAAAAMRAVPKVLSPTAMAVAETAAKQAGQVAGKRAMYGGVYLGSLAQNAPEVFESIYRETGKMEPGIAALASGISSVLDVIVPGKFMSELGGYGRLKVVEKLAKESGAAPSVWKYIAKEAAISAGTEGLTEAAQEAINAAAEQVAGSTKGMLSPENIQRYKESFVKGAIGGGVFGTATGASQGFTAKKEFATAQEAEAYVNQLRAQEAAAGTLTPEKAAEYDAQIANDRAQRQAGLAATFAKMPEDVGAVSIAALMERADNIKEFNPGAYERIYGDIDAAIAANKAKIAKDETKAKAQAQAELNKVEAEYDKGLRNKQAGSAFATQQPTPGTGGMFKPALEQQRAEQQQATRDFAFGPVATNTPGDPVTVNTLKNLKISDRSKVGMGLLGTDLDTADGRRNLIQTLESPNFTGKIDEGAYDDLISTFDPQEVKAHRAEMKADTLSPTKQKQQEQTRAFAFGAPDVTRPDAAPSGGSPSVVSEPAATGVAPTPAAPERGGDVPTQQDVGDTVAREEQQPTTLTEPTGVDLGAAPPQTQQAETQRQEAPAAPRGVLDRPDLSAELPVINEKLGQRGVKLDEQSKDAKAYFGKVAPELALDSIANDLVLQPTAYRNSKMKVFEGNSENLEPLFGNQAEAAFFQGQGGIHAKNAEAWSRANLSPEAVTFLDQKIALYTKEAERSSKARAKQQKQQNIRKGVKTQVAEESAAAKAEGEYAPTEEEIADARGTKTEAGKRKAQMQRLARELAAEDPYGDLYNNADTDTTGYEADADLAALHTQAHPVVLQQLANKNLAGALQALADSGSSKTAELFAQNLSKLVGNVNLVYGVEVKAEPGSAKDRFDQEHLAKEGVTGYKSKHKTVDMNIDDFLNLAKFGRQESKLQTAKNRLAKGENFTSIPYLYIYPTDDGASLKVTGHEGRHRALALKAAGYTTMPVQIRSESNGIRWSEQADPEKFDYEKTWPTRIQAQEGAISERFSIPFPFTREESPLNYSDQSRGIRVKVERSLYDPKTNTVYLRDGATEYEILHEASHATMSHTLDNPSHPVTRQVMTIFNQMKKGTEGTYGAQDIQEFAAEAWSNDAFRNRLKEFKPTGEKLTGWDRLVNAVRQLFRLPPKTALDAIDRMLNDIISPSPATRTGETLYAQSLHNPNVVQEIFTKMGNTARKIPVMNSEKAVGFWKAAEKAGRTGRYWMYRSLNLSALGEAGSKYLGDTATRFANTIEEMAGYQEKMLEAMHPLHDRLAKFRQAPEYQAWSTLVNDSTRVDVNPEAPLSKYVGSPTKEAEWKQLNARFIKLTPEGKKLYRDLFATYKQLDAEFLKSLERNIDATVGDKAQAATAYQKILGELADIRVDHYAPLFREGPFWLQYDINGDTNKEAFESEAELNYARQQLQTKGATKFDSYTRADQLTTKTVPSGTMLAEIMKIMKDNGAGTDAIDDLIQLVVKAMPEASILKSRQKRTGIGGYIDNAAYVFDRVSSNTARQLGRMQYGPELQRLMAEMVATANTARGDVNTYGTELIKEFEGRRAFAMKPTLTAFSQYASSGAFYYNLAGNVSSAVVNTLQTPLVVFPQLGGEYGFKQSYDALKNALKLYTSSGFSRQVTELTGEVSEAQNEFQILNRMGFKAMTSIENLVNSGKAAKYAGLIGAMKDRGLLATSTARSALSSENDNSSGYGSPNKIARVTSLVGSFMFHHAERMNREITAVAAFDLEMGKLKNSNLSEAEKQTKAIDKALKLVEYAHGAGSTLSGPSLGQGDIGKVLMVFKRFAFSMYYMLFDTMIRSLPTKGATGEQLEAIKAARRQLLGIYGMSALFAGVKGIPLYWVAEAAYNMFQGDDDDDFDTVMREFLGDFPFKGPVNYFTNLSVADRVGWTDLLWREQKGSKADASALSQILETALGAPYSIANSLFRAKDLIAEGQYERGIEAMLPVSMRNVLKGGRYAIEGANTLRGDAVGDVNGYNAAMQVLGFAPADLMKQYEENAYMTEKGKAIKAIEKNALKKYYAAMREGDADGMMDAREKLFELGAKYPELGISEKTITQSVKARERITNEMHHGVQLDRKLAPYLKQAAAEAYGD